MSSAVCSPAADNAFGPAVEGCRQGFDFTFAFESYLFSIVSSVLLLCFAPLRFKTLSRVRPKIEGNAFKYVKLVSQKTPPRRDCSSQSLLLRLSLPYLLSFN